MKTELIRTSARLLGFFKHACICASILTALPSHAQSEKDQIAFLKTLEAIAKHDVTDVKFVSKKLKARFELVDHIPRQKRIYKIVPPAPPFIKAASFKYSVSDDPRPYHRWADIRFDIPTEYCVNPELISKVIAGVRHDISFDMDGDGSPREWAAVQYEKRTSLRATGIVIFYSSKRKCTWRVVIGQSNVSQVGPNAQPIVIN